MKNEKIEVVNEVTEVEETEETKRNALSKPIGWIKRNGKKIVTGVAVGAGLVLAYGLGKKSAGGSDDSVDEETDDNAVDVDFTEIESEE